MGIFLQSKALTWEKAFYWNKSNNFINLKFQIEFVHFKFSNFQFENWKFKIDFKFLKKPLSFLQSKAFMLKKAFD